MNLIATSTVGLEAVVARELEALGYPARIVSVGRIAFEGDQAAIFRANTWLRCADRVLIEVGSFQATDFGELFDRTNALPWDQWIASDAEFPVRGRSVKSKLSSVPACQKICKKAIVEKLRKAHNVATLPETGARCVVEVSMLNDVATLTLDTTGPGLNKRGYRQKVGKAPLKETLAAGLVQLSFWKPDRPLVDPFCGGGTIGIEAALIGRNMAPGMNRTFIAGDWPTIDSSLAGRACEEAKDLARFDRPLEIIGYDIDPEQTQLARDHAHHAGLGASLKFRTQAFADLDCGLEYGCMFCNPPYAERIGEKFDVEEIYRSMPDVLRRLKTWSHYILTSYPRFEAIVGQPANRRRKLYNGPIECTYFQFHGPRPPRDYSPGEISDDAKSSSQPISQAFGGLDDRAEPQAEMFANRLAKQARHLRKWPAKRGITCYRLYDRDIPEIPLAVDLYEGRLHIAEYDRPHNRTPGQHVDWLEKMASAAGERLEIPPDKIFLKTRRRQRGANQYERMSEGGSRATVSEGGCKFLVNLSDYIDTGLFLDHRITRGMVRDEAAGKRMLNLFAYTGAFSVYAADGGAVGVTTVDLSNTYLDWARANFRVNEIGGEHYRFVRSGAMEFLRDHGPGDFYDLAVVDPPTFSNSKSTEGDFDIQRDYAELLGGLVRLMSPGGVIYFSTNFKRFKFDQSVLAGCTCREISKQTIPEDFRNKRIHRCWRIVVDDKS
ncbi:MAG: bifunctional 23S rRNA (guanine(2069)-N(7))-methyltransferase RlmK/23S rRNA (guanine(2445)-N(2))-methyltransferase RlmL [Phycisphaerae bacterium]|jgi:23S rRNA (guanine2445-N2)-methyltransferase / 23S rRNA (guanine2069-N7)-methyltransferase|nr:bifunctional 23S rRNA (guanine(2069)-N(7))-methyltransferase RlmK/23S rRNA (guanine(2445)-N(2))-methyltransferase RlmL [Phycisphaerae bacterium]